MLVIPRMPLQVYIFYSFTSHREKERKPLMRKEKKVSYNTIEE